MVSMPTDRKAYELKITREPSAYPVEDAQGALLQAQVLALARKLCEEGFEVGFYYRVEGTSSVFHARATDPDHLHLLADVAKTRYGYELPSVTEVEGTVKEDPTASPALQRGDNPRGSLCETMNELLRLQEKARCLAAALLPRSEPAETASAVSRVALGEADEELAKIVAPDSTRGG